MPDIDKNYYLDREGIDTLATEVKSKIADAAKTVKQSATTTNADYEVLFSQSANNTTTTEEAGKNSNLKFNPSTGNLQTTQLNGVTIGNDPKFTDNNTTYTFTDGTNGFTVTPSGGTAQTVTVTPSITNNITGSGTSDYIAKFNGANTITNGPAFGSDTTKFLRNDGTWSDMGNPKKVDISNSSLLDYRRCVIALCRISTSPNTSLNSYSAGTISFHRDNGLNGVIVIDYAIENQYATAYATNVYSSYSNLPYVETPSTDKTKSWSWCSFKHNDVYYAGIEYYQADAMVHNIVVDYVGNFEPFAFAWYNANTSEVIDTEFSNSVSYTTPTHKTDSWLSEKLNTHKAINPLVTGTGTPAQDKGEGVSPRYFPATHTYNIGTALDGDIITVKTPVTGHNNGTYVSSDNGTNYYPVASTGTTRLTSQYPVGTTIQLVFDSSGSVESIYPLNGGDSRVTVTGGAWRVINYYDSGNTYVTQTATASNNNYEVLFSATADNTTRTETARKNNNLLFNPSTGNLQATQLNGVTIGSSPKFTDHEYTANMGLTLSSGEFNIGQRWTAITQGQKWSRLYLATPNVSTVGSSGFLNITATRGSMVTNATFYITTSHAGATYSTCQCISSCNYTQVRSRIVVNSSGYYYFEIYDDKVNIASGTTQTWNCCFVPFASTTLTAYTAFTDGTTIPDGYTATNDFTTTGGNSAIAIKDISRSGTTFTATRLNGSTFTFTQQDTNTTYTFTNGGTNKFTVTPSGGSAQDVTFTASDSTKVAKTGDLMTGTLRIESTNGNYGEGIRINKGNGGYSTLVFNTNVGTTNGIQDGAWWIGANNDTYGRKLFIAHNGSGTSTTYFYADSSSQVSPSLRVGSNIICDGVIASNQTSGTSGGFSLYGGAANVTSYGIAMRTTANSGKHGYVQGDWGGYFYFAGATTRGLVYRHASANVASISGDGNAVFNGSVTIGGNTTNTSGARMEYNSTTQSIDFVFV